MVIGPERVVDGRALLVVSEITNAGRSAPLKKRPQHWTELRPFGVCRSGGDGYALITRQGEQRSPYRWTPRRL
jgi:hypothetical protein